MSGRRRRGSCRYRHAAAPSWPCATSASGPPHSWQAPTGPPGTRTASGLAGRPLQATSSDTGLRITKSYDTMGIVLMITIKNIKYCFNNSKQTLSIVLMITVKDIKYCFMIKVKDIKYCINGNSKGH